jgi:hypothetical protein
MTTAASSRSVKAAPLACSEMRLQRGAGHFGDRAAASLCFMAKPCVQFVWELHRGTPHVCQHTMNPTDSPLSE